MMDRAEREKAVDWFAEQVKTRLREPNNEAKSSWREDTLYDLLSKLKREANALRAELRSEDEGLNYDAIISEAADVSAYSMMIADVARILKD